MILKVVRVVGLLLAAQLSLLSPAKADYRNLYPQQLTLSPKGVNIQTGRFTYQRTDLSIGPLKLVRSLGGGSDVPASFGVGQSTTAQNKRWTHNFASAIKVDTATSTTYYRVTIESAAYSFKLTSGGSFVPGDAGTQGMRLDVPGGGQFTVTDHSGNQYSFVTQSSLIVLQRILYANGSAVTITNNGAAQPRLIASNLGYAIVLDYSGANVIAACGFNTAQTYVTSATTCSGSPAYVVKASYGYDGSSRLSTVTDTRGGVTTFTYAGAIGTSGAYNISCVSMVNSSNCALQNVFGERTMSLSDQVTTQTTATGNVWHYDYTPPENPVDVPPQPCWPYWSDASMTDAAGRYTGALYDRGYLVRVDAPEATTQYLYPNGCSTGNVSVEVRLPRPTLVRKSGGIREYYEYDSRGNVVRKVLFPIGVPDPNTTSGSQWIPSDPDLQKCCVNLGIPQIPSGSVVYQYNYLASYGAGSSTWGCGSGPPDAKLCDKPTSTIDPNGNQTDYTYDAAHGGIRTETKPAVNGVRPQTRYTYVQRQAWVKNSGGGYSPTGESVWLLAAKSLCKTSAWNGTACVAGAADEVTTAYDYGPDSGPSNLLLRGVVEDSGAGRLNLRTCYSYDAQGNKISETKPRGTGATCP